MCLHECVCVRVCVFVFAWCQCTTTVPVPKRLHNVRSRVRRAHCRVRVTPIESRQSIVIFSLNPKGGVSHPTGHLVAVFKSSTTVFFFFLFFLFLKLNKKKVRCATFGSTKLMFRAPLRWIKSWIYFALCMPCAAECRKIFFSVRSSLVYLLCCSFFFLFYLVVVHVLLPRCSVWRLFFWAFFKVTVLPQSLLSFTHIFRFRLHLSSLYRVLFFCTW